MVAEAGEIKAGIISDANVTSFAITITEYCASCRAWAEAGNRKDFPARENKFREFSN